MYPTIVPASSDPRSSVSFLLAKVGQASTIRFAAKLAPYGVKPKHVGLLALLSGGTRDFQQELGRRLGVAPSLIVAMADELEHLGAITRIRDPEDRRKSTLEVTDRGRDLLKKCTQALQEVDDELLTHVSQPDREILQNILSPLLRTPAEDTPREPRA